MIEQLLKQLGLDEKEAKVYLAIQKIGKAKANNISLSLGIKRTTVYSVVKELISKGLVKEDLGEPVTCYVSCPPEDLLGLVRIDEKKLKLKKLIAEQAIEKLKELKPNFLNFIPKISFISEHQIEDFLYKRTKFWAESIKQKGGTWWGFQDHTFVQHYEKWIDWSWESGVQKDINLKLLSNIQEKNIKKKTFIQREIKFWRFSQNFTASTWICGDFVILLYTNKKPHYAIEIFDQAFAQNQREIFKGIWKI